MIFKKKNIKSLFLFNIFKNKDFSKISPKFLKGITLYTITVLLLIFGFICFEVYIPLNPISHETITYIVKKGMSRDEIAKELKDLGIIRNTYFFNFYAFMSLQHTSLQAGKYSLSPRMSIYQIVKRLANGDVIKNLITIPEGWSVKEIADYIESKNICSKEEFLKAVNKDYSQTFDFLKEKPKDIDLEGYLFPDTYQIADGDNCDTIVLMMLLNFNKKINSEEIRKQIEEKKLSIFEVVTIASLLEKEVHSLKDKKIVSGILWKRLSIDMPLQLDATVNYITGKNDPAVLIKDTKIDSPYNTYKYKGLPKGPISNPGMDSIIAAINPTKTDYLFYLTDGVVHYSKTAEEHAAKKAEYLNK